MDLFPNETVVFQWFLFITALVALNYGVFRPVLHILQERKNRTEGERKKSEELFHRAENLLTECEKKIAEAHKAGAQEREKLLRETSEKERVFLQQRRGEVDKKMEELRSNLGRQYHEASLQLKQYGQKLGHEIAEKVLGRGI